PAGTAPVSAAAPGATPNRPGASTSALPPRPAFAGGIAPVRLLNNLPEDRPGEPGEERPQGSAHHGPGASRQERHLHGIPQPVPALLRQQANQEEQAHGCAKQPATADRPLERRFEDPGIAADNQPKEYANDPSCQTPGHNPGEAVKPSAQDSTAGT